MRVITTCSKPRSRPANTTFKFSITALVCATMPSGSTPGICGVSGIWPVTKTKPSVSTAWLKGATGFGPPLIMWNFTGGSFGLRRVQKQALADDRVHAPIAVDHLRDAEVDGGRHQRDRLVLAQPLHVHQEASHLAKRIFHGEVERGLRVNLALALSAELGEVVGMAESGQDPIRFGLDQGIREIGKGLAGEVGLLVQDHLEGSGHRAFNRGAAQFAVALRGMGIADR